SNAVTAGLFHVFGRNIVELSIVATSKSYQEKVSRLSISSVMLLPVEKFSTSLLANSKLHRTLYGFVVFKVAWDDVLGINYVNELQVFLVQAR
ncbi:hypothetical protein Tco_1083999, partial [Tanacetum coccineum]